MTTRALLRHALRNPVAATRGVVEFRLTATFHYDSEDLSFAYDCGRELAHRVTMRRWEP